MAVNKLSERNRAVNRCSIGGDAVPLKDAKCVGCKAVHRVAKGTVWFICDECALVRATPPPADTAEGGQGQ